MLLTMTSDFFLSKDQLEKVREKIEEYYRPYLDLNEADKETANNEMLDAISRAYRPVTLEVEFLFSPSTGYLSPINITGEGQ